MNAQNAKDYLPLVQALADDKLQGLSAGGVWVDLAESDFSWPIKCYRIKPEPKPPYKRYAQVAKTDTGVQISFLTADKLCVDNVEFTFNGDTHELISVEKI
jgi:hypothetical protein